MPMNDVKMLSNFIIVSFFSVNVSITFNTKIIIVLEKNIEVIKV